MVEAYRSMRAPFNPLEPQTAISCSAPSHVRYGSSLRAYVFRSTPNNGHRRWSWRSQNSRVHTGLAALWVGAALLARAMVTLRRATICPLAKDQRG